MKRIILFVLTNLAVVLVIGVVAQLLGLNRYITSAGLDLPSLLGFCLLFGFGGAFISLLISRPVAKWSTGARVITGTEGATEAWLVQAVTRFSNAAGIPVPEVAVYEGAPNAFATGATKSQALVAVSSGLLQTMDRNQVEAVLAHEVAHISNGDSVTMTLIQGVMNTFVMFFARVVGYFIDRVVLKSEKDEVGIGYTVSVVVLDLLFGVLAALVVAAFSRHREFRADAGAAKLVGSQNMISALSALGMSPSVAPAKNLAAFGISGGGALAWFSSHPSITARIEALRQLNH